jgi:hypothetical protein
VGSKGIVHFVPFLLFTFPTFFRYHSGVPTGKWLILRNFAFLDNVVGSLGGGALTLDNSHLKLDTCTFKRNKLLEGNGGAIAAGLSGTGGVLHIENSVIMENEATLGGAIYMQSGELSLADTSVLDNIAHQKVRHPIIFIQY